MSAPPHVLIGTDVALVTDPVVAVGLGLARALGARVTLLHAYEALPAWGAAAPMGAAGGEAAWLDELRQRSQAALEEQARRCGLRPGDEIALRVGSPARVLAEVARERQSAAVVAGAAPNRSRRALGSTADRVLRLVPCPVLLMRPGLTLPPRRVLAPVDLSALSAEALRAGLELLAKLGTPEWIEVLFVLHPLERENSLHFSGQQIDRFAADELRRFAEREGGALRPWVRTRVRVGYPQQEILAALEETGADLLLIGTHGRSGFERLLLGSVTAATVRDSAVSTLVLPPGAALEEVDHDIKEVTRSWADWQHVSDETSRS